MNTIKLLLSVAFALTINATASDKLTPVEQYTVLKNSSYLNSLERERALAVQERDNREQLRKYMELKLYVSSSH